MILIIYVTLSFVRVYFLGLPGFCWGVSVREAAPPEKEAKKLSKKKLKQQQEEERILKQRVCADLSRLLIGAKHSRYLLFVRENRKKICRRGQQSVQISDGAIAYNA